MKHIDCTSKYHDFVWLHCIESHVEEFVVVEKGKSKNTRIIWLLFELRIIRLHGKTKI